MHILTGAGILRCSASSIACRRAGTQILVLPLATVQIDYKDCVSEEQDRSLHLWFRTILCKCI